MLPEERLMLIVEQINQEGAVTVKALSEQYGVTPDMIRKDLTKLEKQGLLKKSHGGAVKVRMAARDFQVEERMGKNNPEKRKIASRALELIEDGDVVFLDISTSNIELARLLVNRFRHVVIVTNMIEIMQLLREAGYKELIFLGGTLSDKREGFVGALTNQQIQQFRFDKAFLGVVGVDLAENKVATYDPEDGITKRTVMGSSRKSYMMLESRKLEEDGQFWYAKVSDFTGAVMEKEPDAEAVKKAVNYSLEWYS